MNIKKIILEEMDDFDWIRDTHDPTEVGLVYQTPSGNTLKIINSNEHIIIYELYDVDRDNTTEIDIDTKTFTDWVNGGTWVRVDKMVNESVIKEENPFDWIKDVNPITGPVTEDNWSFGARVMLNEDSRYYNVYIHQSEGFPGTIEPYDGENDIITTDLPKNVWVRVVWDNDDSDTYAIGPTDFDLVFYHE